MMLEEKRKEGGNKVKKILNCDNSCTSTRGWGSQCGCYFGSFDFNSNQFGNTLFRVGWRCSIQQSLD